MAKVRWDGREFDATPIINNGDGSWMMRANEHGARFGVGSVIQVKDHEVTQWDTTAVPPANAGLDALEAAMAEERKTLPSVKDVIANNRPIAHDAPDMGVSVPDHPTEAPERRPITE